MTPGGRSPSDGPAGSSAVSGPSGPSGPSSSGPLVHPAIATKAVNSVRLIASHRSMVHASVPYLGADEPRGAAAAAAPSAAPAAPIRRADSACSRCIGADPEADPDVALARLAGAVAVVRQRGDRALVEAATLVPGLAA